LNAGVVMAQWVRHFPWLKSQFSHYKQIVGNIGNIVSNQLNKIYNIGLVVFGYFTAKILLLGYL